MKWTVPMYFGSVALPEANAVTVTGTASPAAEAAGTVTLKWSVLAAGVNAVVVAIIIGSLVLVNALGLCVTYGHLEIPF